MESFVDRDSIGFELTKYVINDVNSNDKKELTFDNLKFTSKTLKYVFGDKMKDDKFKEYIINAIKEMISLGWIAPNNKAMFITDKMITNFYNIN